MAGNVAGNAQALPNFLNRPKSSPTGVFEEGKRTEMKNNYASVLDQDYLHARHRACSGDSISRALFRDSLKNSLVSQRSFALT